MSNGNFGKAKRSDKMARVFVGLVGLLLLVGFTVVVIRILGYVQGEEFSPDSFTRRTYTYYRIPLIHLQVSAIDRTTTTGDLETYLTTNNFIATTNSGKEHWDTIQASAGFRELPVGDAAILFRYLNESTAPGGVAWLEWTKSNQPAGKVLWPIVANLARDRLYFFIPELLTAAGKAENADEFAQRAQQYAAKCYVQLGDIARETNRHAKAVQYYTTALEHQPEHPEAAERLAESQRLLPAESEMTN